MQEKNKILIFLPARNEAKTIASVIGESKKELAKNSITADFLVVDDGSTDETKSESEKSGAFVISYKEKKGLGFVFREAVKYSIKNNYDILITIDSDKQFKESEIIKFINVLEKNEADFVTGSRFLPQSQTVNISKVKKIGNKIGAWYISSVLKKKFSDVTCGFRGYNREAMLHLHTFSDFTYTQEVFMNLGIKKLSIVEIPITTVYYKDRKSKMVKSVFSYIAKSIKIILKFMILYAPMRLFSKIGNLFFILGLIGTIFVFFWDRHTGTVTPYKWVGVMSLFLGSGWIIMYSVGMLLQVTSRIQLTIEEQLYLAKKNLYGK